MKKFKLFDTIYADRIMLVKRDHTHDEELWPTIDSNRYFLREYLFWVDDVNSIDDVAKDTDMFNKCWDEDIHWCYDIFTICGNKLVGSIGVFNINFKNQGAEIGYWLKQNQTGRGYMTEAVRAVEKELFKAGMHRLVIRCDVNNHSSAKVAMRAGYRYESTAEEAVFHYTGLHNEETYVKLSPYPVRDL